MSQPTITVAVGNLDQLAMNSILKKPIASSLAERKCFVQKVYLATSKIERGSWLNSK